MSTSGERHGVTMEDPELNRILDETKELQIRWGQFRDFVRAAMGGQAITAAHELKFMDLKSRIAMLHDSFTSLLRHEERKTGQMLLTIISESILLRRIALTNESEKQKFEYDWNDVTMLLTEHIASLEAEKERVAAINPRAFARERAKERMKFRIRNFLNNTLVRFAAIVLVLAGTLIFTVKNGILDLEALSGKPYIGAIARALNNIISNL